MVINPGRIMGAGNYLARGAGRLGTGVLRGQYGGGLTGAAYGMIGGAVGGATYGGMTGDGVFNRMKRGVIGGLTGAAMGGGIGYGAGFARAAAGGYSAKNLFSGTMRGRLGSAWAAGKKDALMARGLARSSSRLVGNTARRAVNPVRSTMKRQMSFNF